MERRIHSATAAVFLLCAGALLSVYAVRGQETRHGLVLALWLLLFGSLAAWLLTTEPALDRLRPAPKLAIGKTYSEVRPSAAGIPMQVIRAEVYNAQDVGGEHATAGAVVPFIEAFTATGDPVASTRGSWGYDVFGGAVSTVTFRPTRESHPLEVVAKFPDDSAAWLPGASDPELVPGEYRIKISLRGDRLRKPAVFEWDVENPGKGGDLRAALRGNA